MRTFLTVFFFSFATAIYAQQPAEDQMKIYRATSEKINSLVHTKLDARFDYAKQQLIGKAWLTLKPHFYATDSLTLDAKGMDIKQVALTSNGKNTPLKYRYDGLQLHITLNRSYKGGEPYTVYIDYVAKPNEFESKGSAAITDAKGLYFINPLGEDKNKPTQIWTQGETEATSVWVPTIDKPNQKTTNEFALTVPSKYVTLSNGKLVSQRPNSDGTRTDTWKMEQPHAPYLFFIGVGEYAIIKDKYKDKEVSYYVEKEYAPVARRIFGNTPEMMALYSRLTGVDYPWVKYAQIVGRDYVSGAMENTTATLHGEGAQQDARELTDDNRWEETIAHELFHQWFGDYTTAESWSNITMNESFATIGSQLWNEFKYGKDAADAERYNSLQGYYASRSDNKPLVRFHYNDKEDVFDAVSYNKGAGILQMLRNYIGDSAFFKSLNVFLTTYKFKAVEPQQLRLVMEDVTGKDLNWFFNQWYYGAGHPKFKVRNSYDEHAKQAITIVEQTQTGQTFSIPVKVRLWTGGEPATYTVWTQNKIDTFRFASATKPLLVNFDADKILVAERDESKSLDNYMVQYKAGFNYIDRREAIDAALRRQSETGAVEIIRLALRDHYAPLRTTTIQGLDMQREAIKAGTEQTLLAMAQNEKSRLTKAAAIAKLGELRSNNYRSLFLSALNDSSYTVSGMALDALFKIDSVAALEQARRLSAQPAKGRLSSAITTILMRAGDQSAANQLLQRFQGMRLSDEKFQVLLQLKEMMKVVKDEAIYRQSADAIMAFAQKIPEAYQQQLTTVIRMWMTEVQQARQAAGDTQLANYMAEKLKELK